MPIILLIVQCLANLLLALTIGHISRTCKIPLTVHNIPIVIFCCMGLGLIIWLSVTHISLFIMGGVWISILLWMSLSKQNVGIPKRLGTCMIAFIIWAQLLTIMIFYATHHEKIDNENPELR